MLWHVGMFRCVAFRFVNILHSILYLFEMFWQSTKWLCYKIIANKIKIYEVAAQQPSSAPFSRPKHYQINTIRKFNVDYSYLLSLPNMRTFQLFKLIAVVNHGVVVLNIENPFASYQHPPSQPSPQLHNIIAYLLCTCADWRRFTT